MYSRRFISFSFLVLLAFFLMAAAHTTGRALAYKNQGVVIVNPPNNAPLSYVDANGEPQGYIVDIWKKWSLKTGVPVTFKAAPWHETLEMVRTVKADIQGGLFQTTERDEFLAFSEPYSSKKP